MLVTVVHIQGLLHGVRVVSTLAEQRSHVGAAVYRQVGIMVAVVVNIAVVEHTVIVVAACASIIHHTRQIGA